MRFFCISDNHDTLTGMRLAGIEGTQAFERHEVQSAIDSALARPEVGVLLITEKLAALCPDVINDLKLKHTKTLVVEIPDRMGTGRAPDSITRYIRESIGVKV